MTQKVIIGAPRVVIGALYEHWKGGVYRVLHRAWESTNGRDRVALVVYVSLRHGCINVRTESEFLGLVDSIVGNERFKLLKEP